MARHKTQNGEKCCDSHSLFKIMFGKRNDVPCPMTITQIARRRISVPSASGQVAGDSAWG